MRRRQRRMARDIAPTRSKNHFLLLILVAVGLAFVLFFRASMGDSNSDVWKAVVGNPELELPLGPTDRAKLGASATDVRRVSTVDAGSEATKE